MSRLKYVIVPTSEVTDEMRDASDIEFVSPDGSKTVFDYLENKPSCFNSYDELSLLEWNNIYDDSDGDGFWNPYPDGFK